MAASGTGDPPATRQSSWFLWAPEAEIAGVLVALAGLNHGSGNKSR
jgi:hypothetical protein